CSHGTHIAGMISGDDPVLRGVAPDAGILAIRVGAVLDTGPDIPELGVLRGLEHVYDLRDTHDIVAVNLSFGGPPDGCAEPAWEDVIGRLTQAGIAVVAAAGNSGDPTEITF
ncbi:MAG: S8 family serine peptidase, partial [Actinobacteria bacterium]|nr:S8 family serine peptidase [Actinomycetota bacterium]NIS32337.1 S8 family serine peptidase [Actinomycetota bacterium]NIT96212.1 S8 family serine peptidase [Actinomycetota bacterium]NIU19901.1 S8 family serine peptidase [Actinomycetota bacterium]NIU67369.1 S8 family serine peptidase [Actinomycetota bacterium]